MPPYDPRDVSVRIGDYELPGIQDIDPDYGESVEPISSNQGFVDHQIKLVAASCKIKFKAEPENEVVAGLAAYFKTHVAFTATIITPEYTATFTSARLHAYPKKTSTTSSLADYDIEFSGKSGGPRYA